MKPIKAHGKPAAPAPGNNKQAVSLARRMAGKKGAVVQLQAEINTEDDWDKLLTRDGLIVVDVYSDWCGPCVGMVGNLKKCKLEMGGDLLHLAIAKSDDIGVLKRFRNKSEPTWMFISGGQLLHVLFGANAPRLMQLIEAELKNEPKVKSGEMVRKTYLFDELTPEEEKRAAAMAARKAEEARLAAERELAARNEERDRRYSQMTAQLLAETVLLLLPHTQHDAVITEMVEAVLAPVGITTHEACKIQITPEIWEEITYRESRTELDYQCCFETGQCCALLVKCSLMPPAGVPLPEQLGDIERLVWETINMSKIEEGKLPTPHQESISTKFSWTKESVVEEPIDKDAQPKSKKGKKSDSADSGQETSREKKRVSKGSEKSSNEESELAEDESKKNGDNEEENEEEAASVMIPVPGLYTPVSYFSKCAAVTFLFPERAQKIAVAERRQLPPRLIVVFEPSKAEECFALAEDMKDDVLDIGFFSSADLEEATLIARNSEQYSTVPHAPENKLIVVVANGSNEPALEFVALGPQYVSPNDVVGSAEADKLFPLPAEMDLPEEVDEDDEHLRSNDGMLAPTTAVAVK